MKQQTATALSLVLVGALVAVAFLLRGGSPSAAQGAAAADPGVVPDGAQVVTISAKGGYSPATQTARAGVPTVLRVETNGTYDCSTSLRVPALGISKRLPPTGETIIALGMPEVGVLQGTCSMGMYSFAVNFQA